ncbi:MAG TPA: OmpH family outer membrane protein [Bacteroidia bacterium]|nr:OmpH family outer membrane protein [Bacteroidia bacterium]
MKNNLSLALNFVLLICVIVLFYLHFADAKKIENANASTAALVKKDTTPNLKFDIPKNLAGAKVLYVNIDSIDSKYAAFADLSAQSTGTYNHKMQVYQQKALALQNRYEALQSKTQMGTISADDAAKEEAAINLGMDSLKKMENDISMLENQAMQKNAIITNEITNYFKEYSHQKGIDFILGYGGGNSGLLFANDSLDVTDEVVAALNANYAATKAAKGGK